MTIIIIIITVALSLLAFSNQELMRKWIFNPYMVYKKKEWWRFFTSGFIHADYLHLGLNMFVFYSFGQAVEYYFGEVFNNKAGYYFILLYLGGMLISSAPTYKKNRENYLYNSLGASGAVAAILFAAILFNPWGTISLFFAIKLPAIVVAILYLIFEYRMSKQSNDNINHDAHLWGAIFGLIFPLMLKPELAVVFVNVLMEGP